jgi:hypothetical protein
MLTYFRFESLTAAQSSKRLLQRNGFSASVRRDPKPDRKTGCAFALYAGGNPEAARRLLQSHGFLSDVANTP